MDKAKELINNWRKLNDMANKLLNEHKSFRKYNNVRLKMDKIESILENVYNVDVDTLS
jgi:hypothetical protein